MNLIPAPASRRLSRRDFLRATTAVSAFTILPAHAAPQSDGAKPNDAAPPSEKVNMAFIGIGAQGGNIARTIFDTGLVNVVALCDVDMESNSTAAVRKLFPDVPRFQDFRKMFDQLGSKIDAVTVGVPDHSHFPICILAMSMGKHVYVEKPLAHTFREVELLMAAEKKYKVACQMGNQGHSGGNFFQFKAWTEAGVIKDVTRIDAFMNGKRRWHEWHLNGYPEAEPLPKTLDWDVWHTTAEMHPFSKFYHPGNWRGWYAYGNGALGDWGPHILDTVHEFLDLGLPEEISAVKREGANDFIFPMSTKLRFAFPARGDKPAVEVFWYDGLNNKPEFPPELKGMKLPGNGKIIHSKQHVLVGGTHGDTVRIAPEAKMKELGPTLPKVVGKNSSHHKNFVLACKGQETCRSRFAVAGPLTQVLMLGVIAQRLGGSFRFDRATGQITDNKTADALLSGPPPRKGWEQFYRL